MESRNGDDADTDEEPFRRRFSYDWFADAPLKNTDFTEQTFDFAGTEVSRD